MLRSNSWAASNQSQPMTSSVQPTGAHLKSSCSKSKACPVARPSSELWNVQSYALAPPWKSQTFRNNSEQHLLSLNWTKRRIKQPNNDKQIQTTCFSKCLTLTLSMIMSVYSDSKVVHIPWLNVKIQLCCSAMVLFQKHCWKYGGLKLPCTLVKEKRCFVISFVPKHANKFPLGAIPTKLLLLVRSKELSCPVPSRAR